jgi:hypothetical protein
MEYNLIYMFTIINDKGQYLTNYGMQKYWFTDNIEFAYRFSYIQEAQRFAKVYKCTVISL